MEKSGMIAVGVGTSAGGLDSLLQMFGQREADSRICFFVVQHQARDFPSYLREALAGRLRWEVLSVNHGSRINGGAIYICPADFTLSFQKDCIQLEAVTELSARNPIDHLFRSLGEAFGRQSAAVVLSGLGNDGSQGLGRVASNGGLVLIEDPKEAAYPEMPQHASEVAGPHLVGKPKDFLGEIQRFTNRLLGHQNQILPAIPTALNDLRELLQRTLALPLKGVSDETLGKVLQTRASGLGYANIEAYLATMTSNESAAIRFADDLILQLSISRGSPLVLDSLTKIVDDIFAAKRDGMPVRAWVVGAGTGELTYRLAMQMHNVAERTPFKIFATDFHSRFYRLARTGVFPSRFLDDLPENLREFYMKQEGDEAIVRSFVREPITFAAHNYFSDPPFPCIDLVVLLHNWQTLNAFGRDRFIASILQSQQEGGFVFSPHSEVLELPKPYELQGVGLWHRPRRWPARAASPAEKSPMQKPREKIRPSLAHTLISQERIDSHVQKLVLGQSRIPQIVLRESGKIEYLFGNLATFTKFTGGRMIAHLDDALDGSLIDSVRGLMKKCRDNSLQSSTQVDLFNNAGSFIEAVSIHVSRLDLKTSNGESLFLLQLEPHPYISQRESPDEKTPGLGVIQWELEKIRSDLGDTNNELRESLVRLESVNEALQFSNEDLMAKNEEAQHALDESQAVGTEYRDLHSEATQRVTELESLHKDYHRLMTQMQTAFLILDDKFRLVRCANADAVGLPFQAADAGRSFLEFGGDLSHELYDLSRSAVLKRKPLRKNVSQGPDSFLLQAIPTFGAAGGVYDVTLIASRFSGKE